MGRFLTRLVVLPGSPASVKRPDAPCWDFQVVEKGGARKGGSEPADADAGGGTEHAVVLVLHLEATAVMDRGITFENTDAAGVLQDFIDVVRPKSSICWRVMTVMLCGGSCRVSGSLVVTAVAPVV